MKKDQGSSAKSERGSSLAWTALVMLFVVMPLVALLADGTRLYFIDVRLQNAADAACADAAWSAVDLAHYRDTGDITFKPVGEIVAIATDTFGMVMQPDQLIMGVTSSVRVVPEIGNMRVTCFARAEVPLFFIYASRTIETTSAARMRFQ
jgi:hypothetical protein